MYYALGLTRPKARESTHASSPGPSQVEGMCGVVVGDRWRWGWGRVNSQVFPARNSPNPCCSRSGLLREGVTGMAHRSQRVGHMGSQGSRRTGAERDAVHPGAVMQVASRLNTKQDCFSLVCYMLLHACYVALLVSDSLWICGLQPTSP